VALVAGIAGCAGGGDVSSPSEDGLVVPFEKYELANGLNVVLHIDRSDPIAAVAMTFHVGSSREVPGRTGFAHLFEHLFFLDSENLGPGGLDRLMTRIGSSANGSTSRDRTNYYEVVPVDGLEKALWAEGDKAGYFINTVSESVIDKERQVVKNEKRQGVDNAPYGHTSFVIDQALYREGHPYRWQVIGSLADLDAADLADTKAFHEQWYGPNNATLVVAGDIDLDQTRWWIQKYFGEIPARPLPERGPPVPVVLTESVSLAHEDNFAVLPQLTITWPTVPQYHPDSYALGLLAQLLTDGKTAPLYQVLVEDEKLAPAVSASNRTEERAGSFTIQTRAFPGTRLDDVQSAVQRALARFDFEGPDAVALERAKAGIETSFYAGLSSVIGKAFQLAQYNIFAGDPGYVTEDLERSLAVTPEDLRRVYRQYLLDRPFVATSFVPLGDMELALEGSEVAEVVIEPIVMGAEGQVVPVNRGVVPLTPSGFDRTIEPPFGESPTLVAPPVWRDTLGNGLEVLGIEDHEVPLVQFELRLSGGLLIEDPDAIGVAGLLAESMMAGTANRTPEELEEAIDLLGAQISVSSGRESFSIRGTALGRNYLPTMELLEEILLEPRFDSAEFELSRQSVLSTLQAQSGNPNAIAQQVFGRLVYGDHVLAENPLGTEGVVSGLQLADLREFYAGALVPELASFHVAGAVSQDTAMGSLDGLAARWSEAGGLPAFPPPPTWGAERSGLYFVDVPGAAQSVLRIGYLALSQLEDDFYPAQVMNFRLGGGGFASDLTQILREGFGYTYGIGSSFSGTGVPGPFSISSGVRSNVTFESLELIKGLVEQHGPSFDETDLEATQSYLLRANAGSFEGLGAKVGLLGTMKEYGFAADFVIGREQVVREMTIPRIQELAAQYLDPEGMVWLIVGDAATQLERLSALGLGEPILLDRQGRPVGDPGPTPR